LGGPLLDAALAKDGAAAVGALDWLLDLYHDAEADAAGDVLLDVADLLLVGDVSLCQLEGLLHKYKLIIY